MVRNVVGAPVRDNDLFGREEIINLLWDKLRKTNVLLAAPRRFGKTSVMYNLIDHPHYDYRVIHLDLEPIQEPVNFIIELLEQIKKDTILSRIVTEPIKRLGKFFSNNIQSFGLDAEGFSFKLELKEKIKNDWLEFADKVLSKLKDSDQKILFIFDELAYMLEHFEENDISDAEIESFLYWFRTFRQAPDMGAKNCSFLLGSSIGIEQYLAKRKISAVINDLERLPLSEFTPKQAREFVAALCQSEKITLSRSSRELLLQLIGPPIPYFIQIFISELSKEANIKKRKLTPTVVEKIYEQNILGVNAKGYFIHYYERLRHYSKINEHIAKAFLRELCLANSLPKRYLLDRFQKIGGSKDRDDFNQILSNLENDYYIKYDPPTDSYYFASNILKDWWMRYYGL